MKNSDENKIENLRNDYYSSISNSLFSERVHVQMCENCGSEIATHEWLGESLCKKCINEQLKKDNKMEIMELLADDYIDDMLVDCEEQIYLEYGITEVEND